MASSVPQTMRAARLVAYNKPYEFQTVPVPSINANEILIKIAAAGFCHTDYQVYQGVHKSPTPLTGCHEPVGTVAAVGKNAARNFKIGQRVGMLLFKHACGKCDGCRTWKDSSGNPDIRMCEAKQMAGLSHDGGFAEYAVADAEQAAVLPESVSFEQAAPLMCAGSTVWGAIAAAATKAGEPVAVVGIGGLEQLCVQFFKALGHPVVAIDNRPEGRELATSLPEKLRADHVVDINDENAVADIKKWAGLGGVSSVIVCTDRLSANQWALSILRLRGTLVAVGLPSPELDGLLQFDAFQLIFSELTIKGSLVANKELLVEMLALVAERGVQSYITTVKFDDMPKLPEMYMNPHLKGRLVMKV
ncbi:hypothetical protein LTR95_007015 [Oleoguttula sp. CCFEE 5521]